MSTNKIEGLRDEAKSLGINCYQKGIAQLEHEIKEARAGRGPVQDAAPADPRAPRAETRDESPDSRSARIPLGTPQLKMAAPVRDGYFRYWFNDEGDNLYRAQQAGYTFVTESVDGRDERRSLRVGTQEGGAPLDAYLMEIPKEFHDEDQAKAQEAVDEIDKAILSGGVQGSPEQGAFYTPSEGTSIRSET